ncbi:MAG: TAT-variant-translocated molybdopterin oxidoreductase [Phycisphaerales bacterium]|nr:TAT-variant-translocated molybdopterin oxidoreductase [Phycisphaerales bacterium]
MSAHDQCPSSKKAGLPGKGALARRQRDLPRVSGTTGRAYWRSVEEFADTPEFREVLEREFPAGASELAEGASRRTFLQFMGASLALAGAATIPGCRRPENNIVPFSRVVPEDAIPGKPLFYATCMPLPGGGAEGLLIETHEGRPTKVEGNPLHAMSRGKSSSWAQASMLAMYDPDRLMFPMYRPAGQPERGASFDDFVVWCGQHFERYGASGGEGLAFLVEKKSSPSRDSMRARIREKWPRAVWAPYEAFDPRAAADASVVAFGAPMREQLDFSRAGVILSLDCDFLADGPASVPNNRGFAATRRVMKTDDGMSRLYVAESTFSLAGGKADHRLRLAPSRISALAVEIAKAVLARIQGGNAELAAALGGVAVPDAAGLDRAWIDAVAEDLVSAEAAGGRVTREPGSSMILAGPTQPVAVHALCHALNAALGNIGKTIRYLPMPADMAADSAAGIRSVAEGLKSGAIKTLVVLECNPLHTAPADLDFAGVYARAVTICLSQQNSETAAASTWSLNGASYLESWGDAEAWDGSVGPTQPMIAPLYDGKSDLEVLSAILGDAKPDGHEIVRNTWRGRLAGDFETAWRRALHDGSFPPAPPETATVTASAPAVAGVLSKLEIAPAPTGGALDVVYTIGRVHDGRFANVGWLQELPDPASMVVWDNPALVSPATAEALKVIPVGFSADDPAGAYTKPRFPYAAMATLTIGARSMPIAVWVLPGMPDNVVALQLGYGRTECGKVGNGVGFNTYGVRDSGTDVTARGATLAATGDTYMVASTETNWSMEGRTSIVRCVDLPAWQKHGESLEAKSDRLYGTASPPLNFAERLGGSELTHSPPIKSIYENPLNESRADPAAGSAYSQRQQWGMSIDLAACTGCGACTIACQSENNIPVVGKKEVAKGREMHWIRVDRYFTGDDINNPGEMLHQPVPCQQCENAPCETVCPVAATIHGPEGLNYMTYNRCIGTRYCANNCPYKVRRFNFFDYGVTKFNGSYVGEDLMPYWGTRNPNLVPPRLRQKLDEISKMQKNPDVTVRSRGVMEKCSYCVQRINASRIEVKLHDLKYVPDGFFTTACAQACPADAIVFGDILDVDTKYEGAGGGERLGSRVRQMRNHGRTYALLGFLATRPRTTYMVEVKNPNPKLRAPVVDPFHHGGGHGESSEHEALGGAHSDAAQSRSLFLRDAGHAALDRGYALSLRVLGAVTGVHA